MSCPLLKANKLKTWSHLTVRLNDYHHPEEGLTPTVWAIVDVLLFWGSIFDRDRDFGGRFLIRTEIFGVDF